jgi:ATP-dependent Lhr-like helicase
MRDCLHEAMDLDGLTDILAVMDRGEIDLRRHRHGRTLAVLPRDPQRQPVRLLWTMRRSEERRARAVQMRRTLGDAGTDIGADPAAIAAVAESRGRSQDADELHDALLTLVVLPPAAERGRTSRASPRAGARRWCAAMMARSGWRLNG